MISLPGVGDGLYGNRAFSTCNMISSNKLILSAGYNTGAEIYTSDLCYTDTSGNILETAQPSPYTHGYNIYRKINNSVYSYLSACNKIQIFKVNSIDSSHCVFKIDSLKTISAKLPKLNFLQLSPTTSVSLSYTYLPIPDFPTNNDTLVKVNACIPSCYLPPSTLPIIPSATVFPNPTNNYITVNVNAPYDFKLFSSDGKKLMDQKYVKFQKIDLSTYPNGVYFLILYSGSEIYKEKIIKKE